MALGLLIIAGIGQIYLAAKRSYEIQNTIARLQDAGRYTSGVLTEDIRRAGYWGLMDMRSSPGLINTGLAAPAPAIYPTGAVVPAATCALSSSDWGRMIKQNIFGLNDSVTGYDCLNGNWARGDVLVVRYADPRPVTGFDPDALYIRTAPLQASVVYGDPAAPSIPPPPNPSLANYVTATNTLSAGGTEDNEVIAYAYFLANSSNATECGKSGAPPLPALAREELDTSPARPGWPIKRELLTGVEQLQFQYGVDTDGDGSVDIYRNADAVTTGNQWPDVKAVRFWVLVRDDCPDPAYTDTGTYVMGDLSGASAYAPNDHFHRALYTSTVALRN